MTDPNKLRMVGLALGNCRAAGHLGLGATTRRRRARTARLYASSTELVSQITPKTQPSTQPAVRGLILQLGSTSPAAREAAMKKLAAMGKEIVPALREFADAADPELRARVRALIRRAERRLPPPRRRPTRGSTASQRACPS